VPRAWQTLWGCSAREVRLTFARVPTWQASARSVSEVGREPDARRQSARAQPAVFDHGPSSGRPDGPLRPCHGYGIVLLCSLAFWLAFLTGHSSTMSIGEQHSPEGLRDQRPIRGGRLALKPIGFFSACAVGRDRRITVRTVPGRARLLQRSAGPAARYSQADHRSSRVLGPRILTLFALSSAIALPGSKTFF